MTSAGGLYAAEVIERIFPIDSLRFVWTSQRCTRTPDRNTGEYRTIKNLKKLKSKGYPLESIIAVDDKPSVYTRNHGNLVAVQQFLGEEHDAELLLLMRYLDYLSIVPNVRAIEKRRWRAEVTGRLADKINVRKHE